LTILTPEIGQFFKTVLRAIAPKSAFMTVEASG